MIQRKTLTERETLMELISQVTTYSYDNITEAITNHLMMRGVITLPCKLYDTVYLLVKGKTDVFEGTVRRFSINQKCELIIVIDHKENGWRRTGNYKWSSFGKWVFLNKKDAERKLRGEC